MIKLVEALYGLVKNRVMAEAVKTGNAQFVAQLNTACTALENAWVAVIAVVKAIRQVGK